MLIEYELFSETLSNLFNESMSSGILPDHMKQEICLERAYS